MPESGQRTVPITSTVNGETTTTYMVSGGPVACRVSPITQREGLEDQQIQGTAFWLLVLPHGTTTHAKDRWTVTGADGWTKNLEVVGVNGPQSYGMDVRATCLEREVTL